MFTAGLIGFGLGLVGGLLAPFGWAKLKTLIGG